MYSVLASGAASLAKRAAAGDDGGHKFYQLPPWAYLVLLLTAIAFLPGFLFVSLNRVRVDFFKYH